MLKVKDFQGILYQKQLNIMYWCFYRILLYKVHNEVEGWYVLHQNYVSFHSDYGYQSYYYYCGDFTSFLNTTWIPALAWLTANILPLLLLVILSNITNLKIFLDLPDIVLLAFFSHFNISIMAKENQEGRQTARSDENICSIKTLVSSEHSHHRSIGGCHAAFLFWSRFWRWGRSLPQVCLTYRINFMTK